MSLIKAEKKVRCLSLRVLISGEKLKNDILKIKNHLVKINTAYGCVKKYKFNQIKKIISLGIEAINIIIVIKSLGAFSGKFKLFKIIRAFPFTLLKRFVVGIKN